MSISAVHSWVTKIRIGGYGSLAEIKPRRRPRKKEPQTELEMLREQNERLKTEAPLLKKVKIIVEEREARQRTKGNKQEQ